MAQQRTTLKKLEHNFDMDELDQLLSDLIMAQRKLQHTSPGRRPGSSATSRRLSPSEVLSLRQDLRETLDHYDRLVDRRSAKKG